MNRPLAQRDLPTQLVSLITLIAVLLGCQSLSAKFRDASEAWGFAGDGKAAFVDFNNDGWIDLCAGGKLYQRGGQETCPGRGGGAARGRDHLG